MVTSTSRFALSIALIAALFFHSCNSQFGMIKEGVLFDSRRKSKESREEYDLDRMENANRVLTVQDVVPTRMDLHPGFRRKSSAQFKQNQIRRLSMFSLDSTTRNNYELAKKKVVKLKKTSLNAKSSKSKTNSGKYSKSKSSKGSKPFHKSITPPSKKMKKKKAESSSKKKMKKKKAKSSSMKKKKKKKKRKVKNSSLAPNPASSLAPTPASSPAPSLYPIIQEFFFKTTITGTCKLEEIRDSFIDSLTSILPEGTAIEIVQVLENCIESNGRRLMEHDVILRLLAEGDSIDMFTKITQKRPASQMEHILSPSELIQVVNDKRSLIALYILESSNTIVSVETAEVIESPSTAPSLSTLPSVSAPARTEGPSVLPSSTLPSSRPSKSASPSLSWVPSSNPSASMSPSSSSPPTSQPSVSSSTLASVSAPARTASPSVLPSSRPSKSASPSLSWVPSSNPSASMSPSSSSSPTGQPSFDGSTSPPSEANASNSNNPSLSPSMSGTTFPSRSDSINNRPSNFSTAAPSKPPSTPRSSTTLIVSNKMVMVASYTLWLLF